MKIAIPAENMKDIFLRTGRSPGFIIIDFAKKRQLGEELPFIFDTEPEAASPQRSS